MTTLAGALSKRVEMIERARHKAEARFDQLLRERGLRVGAEIGVGPGGHAETLLRVGVVDKMYGVDPYERHASATDARSLAQPEFDALLSWVTARLAPYGTRFQLVRMQPADAAQEIPAELDFAYIQGDEAPDMLWASLCAWIAKVRIGGVIGGGAYAHEECPQVAQAVTAFFRRFAWPVHTSGDGLWWVEKQPLGVSFIVPAYNCAETLPESIASIIEGNLEEGDEILIVDDGSTDNTAQVISALAAQYASIRTLAHRYNKGSAAASRNTAIEQARHEVLFCLDADNLLAPGSVPRLKAFLASSGADAMAFQELWYFENNLKEITHTWTFKDGEITLADALSGGIWPGPSGNYMLTRESWLRAGRYHEFVGGGIDSWAFGIRQLATGSRMRVLPSSGYYHRYGHDSAWIRDSRAGNVPLKALQVLLPYLDLIEDEDVDYMMGRDGRYVWFQNLAQHPIRLKQQQGGQTGKQTLLHDHSLLARFRRLWRHRRYWQQRIAVALGSGGTRER